MSYLKERIKHAIRFRHKRGFGVHSPFMFNLILNVIRDKEKHYTYPELMEKIDRLTARQRKTFRLLSRLTRFLQSQRIVCFGNTAELLTDYLSFLNKNAEVCGNLPLELSTSDFIFIGRNTRPFLGNENLGVLQTLMEGKKCIVISDIYKDNFNGRLWRQLKEKSTVTIDMMRYGLLLFDDKIQEGKYNLML